MNTKKNKIAIAGASILAAFILLFPFLFKRQYIILFKKDEMLATLNSAGLLEGEVISYKDGTISKNESYSNGKKNGWSINYYPSGKIKNKVFFKTGKLSGPEDQYYENGQLNYCANFYNGKRVGGLIWYLENGHMDSYSVFDINGEPFFTLDYKSNDSLIVTGKVLSPDIYSFDEKTKALIVLTGFLKKYSNIQDLYIIAASPPKMKKRIEVNINNVPFDISGEQNNIINIKNAFRSKGIYKIFIKYSLSNKDGKTVDGINLEKTIIKE